MLESAEQQRHEIDRGHLPTHARSRTRLDALNRGDLPFAGKRGGCERLEQRATRIASQSHDEHRHLCAVEFAQRQVSPRTHLRSGLP